MGTEVDCKCCSMFTAAVRGSTICSRVLRFCSRDLIGYFDGYNPYLYVKRSPVSGNEPSGLWTADQGYEGNLVATEGGRGNLRRDGATTFGVERVICSMDPAVFASLECRLLSKTPPAYPSKRLQPATCNLQPAICNLQSAICNLSPVTLKS